MLYMKTLAYSFVVDFVGVAIVVVVDVPAGLHFGGMKGRGA